MSSTRRIVATAMVVALLSLVGPWAHAATPVDGDERLGTWLALAAALVVALVAGAVAAAGPGARPAPAARPAVPPPPARWDEEETPTAIRRYPVNDDDTVVQRALADEVRARRADTAHRPRRAHPDEQR